MQRRAFLKRSSVLPVLGAAPFLAPAAEPSLLKLSCNLYSFNQLLRSGEMTLEEVLAFCSDLGFAAVDPTAYYFPNYPLVPDDHYLYHIKQLSFRLGLDISGTGVRNNFTDPDPRKRRADLALIDAWAGAAAKLGAPVLRVFAGRPAPAGYDEAEVMTWVLDGLEAAAAIGARHGVLIVLQNHAEFLFSAEDVLFVLDRVGSDWLALNLDIGSLPTDDPYDDIARLIPRAVTWQIKEEVKTLDGPRPTDLDRLFRIIRASGYRGYLPIETLGPGDAREKVPAFLQRVRHAMTATL